MRRPDARTLLFERIRTSPPKFVHVVGVPYFIEAEPATDPLKADHVWITFEAPPFGRLMASVNTTSKIAREVGIDSRVRLGIIRSTWSEKPAPALAEIDGLDYAKLEHGRNVFYETYEQQALSDLLVARARTAIRLEVWGELYARIHIGIHQIHSRRASLAVPQDITHRDGALKLYYAEENVAETFLFKFAGQP